MNRKMILYILGILLLSEAGLMLLPVAVDLIYRENVFVSYLITAAILAVVGFVLTRIKPNNKTIYSRDGFVIVSLGWILLSLFGALPFFLNGEIPNYLDAVFETVSGFTTTGASILTDVEALSHANLFWRSFTHWIGGMGVLVFVMAVLPLAGGGGNLHLMRAESPGPDVGKLVPKSISTARILYGIYIALSVLEFILLLIGGMPLFDSITLTFGTAGTGGFGVLNSSVASYNTYLQTVITIFMALFGVNFNIYFLIICGRIKDILKSEELRAYIIIMLSAIVLISFDIRNYFGSAFEAFHHAAFQVSSVMTTTGYSTVDFNQWPDLSRVIMLIVMCIGACAGSTGGGIKVSRILLALKNARRELKHLLHPRSVSVVKFDGKKVNDEVIQSTNVYLFLYVIIMALSMLIVSFDNVDLVSNFSGVIATLNNIGPGLEAVGATGNYSVYNWFSKCVFIVDMLLGRLEIFPMLLLFSRKPKSRKVV
ncbi:MAG: TrkH family potassium uptake protein [Clostridia bacterium]|nr:TrkH family potassium uptake protein [Clostridia bacterium]